LADRFLLATTATVVAAAKIAKHVGKVNSGTEGETAGLGLLSSDWETVDWGVDEAVGVGLGVIVGIGAGSNLSSNVALTGAINGYRS
jgi:hypothetical protein